MISNKSGIEYTAGGTYIHIARPFVKCNKENLAAFQCPHEDIINIIFRRICLHANRYFVANFEHGGEKFDVCMRRACRGGTCG